MKGKGTNLGEVTQHFRHFIPTLPTADVDDDVTVGIFGQGLGDHRLSASEGSGNSSGAALDTAAPHRREEAHFQKK